MRLWSAGCRSKYMGFKGRVKFARKPISIIGKTPSLYMSFIDRTQYFSHLVSQLEARHSTSARLCKVRLCGLFSQSEVRLSISVSHM